MASSTPPPSRPVPPPPVPEIANGAGTANDLQNATVSDVIADSNAKGTNTYIIPPDATKEDFDALKAKAKASLGLPQVVPPDKGAQGLAVPATKAPPIVPTLTVEDVDATETAEAKAAEKSPHSAVSETSTTPGDLPAKKAPVIPDWYKIGWRQVSGIDEPMAEGEERDRGILFQFIDEQYYGEWYHNAAIIIVAVVVTHLMTLLRMGWGWILVLLAFCCTYYSTSMERFRRRAKDDMQRELTKTRLIDETESADWMNHFMQRFWLIYEPILSATIMSSVSQVLSTSTPAFLDALELPTFNLGTKAPHIDHVRTYPQTDDETVVMEWGISFTPNDVMDMTYRQALSKTNPKIILGVRVGKGFTASMPILLEDITFKGVMKIKMKLIGSFPHIQTVDLCFTEKPWFDFVLKPIGGETFGFDITNIPGLADFIRNTVHMILEPMMYEPHVFTLNLEQLMSGVPLDTAIGVLQVTIISGSGIKANKIGGGTPDPYVSISINNTQSLERTTPKMGTRTPVWNETKFVLVSSLSGQLVLTMWDFNEHRKDSELGMASYELKNLLEDASQEGIVSKLFLDAKERGEVKFDVSFFPVLKPAIVDGKPEPLPETNVGIVRIVLHQAKELDPSKNTISKDINAFAKLFVNGQYIHATDVGKHTLRPVWESPKEFLCSDREECIITIKVIDDRDFLKDPVIGYVNIKLEDMLTAKREGRDWFPLSGCSSGRIRVSTEWKPLDMAGSLHGAAKYVPPIGIVRVLMHRAVDVKNVEGGLGGKSDPYVRASVHNTVLARTEVVNNNLSPVWDQFMYIPVHSLKETIYFEVMDYQHLTKDRPLGHVELDVNKLAQAVPEDAPDADKYPFSSLGLQEITEPIRVDNSTKGQIHYTAEFIPAFHLAGVSFGTKNAIEQVVVHDEDDEGDQDVPLDLTYNHASTAKNGEANGAAAKDAPANGSTEVKEPRENGHAHKTHHDEGLAMTKEQILASPSGVIVFDIISGQLSKKGRLEILMDDGYWPVFSTQKSNATSAQWDMVGEGFIKELDFGRVWFRLNGNGDGEKEDIIAEYKVDAKEFLDRALDGPTEFVLSNQDGESRCKILVAAKFVPVPITLSARESMSNQGNLRMEIIDGRDIHGADRSGTSDPYVVVTLNGDKVYKTERKKKTLTPVWNEAFECTVMSRVGADMVLQVIDWNQLGQDEPIGKVQVDLASLEAFTPHEVSLPLSSTKHGDKGYIRVRMLFTPQIVAKSRKSTSTFSTAGRAVTQVGGAPIAVGKGVVGGVGIVGKGVVGGVGNVGKGVKGIFSGKKGGDDVSSPPPTATSFNAPPSSAGVEGGEELSGDQGNLRMDIIDGQDLHAADRGGTSDPYVVVTLNGDKVYKTDTKKKTLTPTWNESFDCSVVSRAAAEMIVQVLDWNALGQDEPIGQARVDLASLQPSTASEISLPLTSSKLGDKGTIRVRLLFTPQAVNKSLKSSSTFNVSGRAGVKGLFGGKKSSAGEELSSSSPPAATTTFDVPPIPTVAEPIPPTPGHPSEIPPMGYNVGNDSQTFPRSGNGGVSLDGTLRVVVQKGQELADSDGDQVRPYVVLSLNGKEYKTKHGSKTNAPEWDESFTFPVSADTKTLHLEVMDHHTIGKDKSIGQADISIWEKLNPNGPDAVSTTVVTSDLRQGVGNLTVRLEFEQSTGLGPRASSIASFDRPSLGSPSRFSMRKAKAALAE
ncbi:related to TCB3-protein localized to membranes, bud-enriched [Serendipita indica DSM 11827]|uniref:Related to TCB3-protein localized to membranes, bud-enriched n=1 Tax=Serendipita indica (strain DSM 11827) TaxID=1109443 RepID=G4THX0_SERID|nr:related to TCB3-protein localized to membranes, bud-enriched [Serendipita indica DSM 11827]